MVKASAKGTLKYLILKGDYLERLKDIKKDHEVQEKGLFVIISDENGREAARHYIPRDSVIRLKDGSEVNTGDIISKPKSEDRSVIAQWDPYSNPVIAEISGVVAFEDIEPGFSATEQYDEWRECKFG